MAQYSLSVDDEEGSSSSNNKEKEKVSERRSKEGVVGVGVAEQTGLVACPVPSSAGQATRFI